MLKVWRRLPMRQKYQKKCFKQHVFSRSFFSSLLSHVFHQCSLAVPRAFKETLCGLAKWVGLLPWTSTLQGNGANQKKSKKIQIFRKKLKNSENFRFSDKIWKNQKISENFRFSEKIWKIQKISENFRFSENNWKIQKKSENFRLSEKNLKNSVKIWKNSNFKKKSEKIRKIWKFQIFRKKSENFRKKNQKKSKKIRFSKKIWKKSNLQKKNLKRPIRIWKSYFKKNQQKWKIKKIYKYIIFINKSKLPKKYCKWILKIKYVSKILQILLSHWKMVPGRLSRPLGVIGNLWVQKSTNKMHWKSSCAKD